MYIYYPSCNFQRIYPETAAKIRAYLSGQADVDVAGCCRVTKATPRPGDVIVTVCMTCALCLAETRPDIAQISLYELMLTREDFSWPDLHGEELAVQDCFRARGRHALHDAVRACLARMNARPIELDACRDRADFDGAFLLRPIPPRNVREAPEYFGRVLPAFVTPLDADAQLQRFRAQAARYPTARAVGYCNSCVPAAREGGADARHLAELMFP